MPEANAQGLTLAVGGVESNLYVEGDRQLLAGAVANLLQNAFKFTRSDGKVLLTTSASETRVSIAIEDQCGGLPRERSTRCFVRSSSSAQTDGGWGSASQSPEGAFKPSAESLASAISPGAAAFSRSICRDLRERSGSGEGLPRRSAGIGPIATPRELLPGRRQYERPPVLLTEVQHRVLKLIALVLGGGHRHHGLPTKLLGEGSSERVRVAEKSTIDGVVFGARKASCMQIGRVRRVEMPGRVAMHKSARRSRLHPGFHLHLHRRCRPRKGA